MKAGTYQANARVVVQDRVAAIYARSASTEQSSQAINRQMKRCRRYAQEKGWNVIGVFHETGSGSTMNGRLELARMMEAADRRAFDILLVEDITRLSRKAIDTSKIGQVLANHDITIVTVRSGVAGPFGRDGTRRNPKRAA